MAISGTPLGAQPAPPITPIATDRLVLRPTELSDAPALEKIRGSEETTRYLSHEPLDPTAVRDRIASDRERATASTATVFRHAWALELRATGQVIGEASTWTTRTPPEPGHLEPGQAALGYVLDPDYHRQGYGREAAKALVNWLFTERDIRTAFAGVFEPNLASQALLKSLGFTPDRWFTAEQDQSGKGLPSIRFRLDRQDPA
ncbi:GNAT family N-acetyltransferase [Arthrobacter sp. RAF14]|uniref:GNAT family N-acetyltransferase n=1 Tax=Arthrobacter sp. RAF14 TaxID=3233051 RepID=UPI003F8EF532